MENKKTDFYSREELLDMGFAYIGKDVKIFRQSVFTKPSNITLDDGCQIDDFCLFIASQPIKIGKRCHIAAYVSVVGGGEFTLEDYACVAAGTRIVTGSDDFLGGAMIGPCIPQKFRKVSRSFVTIKKHVIIGTANVIYPGVVIGEGAASSAMTLFTKSVEGWTPYRGIPAQAVRPRESSIILNYEKKLVEEYGY